MKGSAMLIFNLFMLVIHDSILLTSGETLRISVKSEGCFDPPYHGDNCEDTVASIVVNGAEASKNQPGFNIVLIDLGSGEIEQSVNFNTHSDAGAHLNLMTFLNTVETRKIICIAIKEDAKNYLPDSAFLAFAKVGASKIIVDKIEYSSSYAFVGITGPEDIRSSLPWITELNEKAGEGPSVINVSIETE